MKFRFVLVACIVLHLCASAQSTQGSMAGRVTSEEGRAVQNASIICKNVLQAVILGTTTTADGYFELSALPVGDYRLEISHVSFSSMVIEEVSLKLGIKLNLGAIQLKTKTTDLEEVVVSGAKVYLSQSTAIESNISRATMNTLPIDRDFKSAITVLPQVNPSYYGDQANMGGATGSENYIFIDGLNVTDNNDVSSSISLPYNFIKEIQVKQGGYEAQYGRSIGGLINAVTQSGTNEAKGQAFAFYTSSALAETPKTNGGPGSAVKNFLNYDAGISYGGPIIKDKLWYFAAYNFQQKKNDREIVGHGFFEDRTTINMFAGKLSWKVSEKTNLSFTILGDPTVNNAVRNFDLLGNVATVVANPDPLLPRYTSGGIYGIVNGQTRIGESVFTEYSLYGYQRKFIEEGKTFIGANELLFTDFASDSGQTIVSGGIGRYQNNSLRKFGTSASVNKLAGSSSIKAGFLLEVNEGDLYYDTPYPGQVLHTLPTEFVSIDVDWQFKPRTLNPAAFVQGNFKVTENLEVTTGLRWDGWYLQGNGSELQSMQLIQPRMGFSYAFGPSSNHRIFSNYGLFYQQLPLYITVGYFTHPEILRIYDSDPRQPSVSPIAELYFAPTDKPDFNNNKNMRPDYLSEWVVGYETILGPELKVGVKGVFRKVENAFLTGYPDFLGQPDSRYGVNGNAGSAEISFLPPVEREYTALELTLQGSTSSRKLTYNFSYVWSRNFGNYTGYFDQDQGRLSQPGNSISYTVPEQANNSTGYMPNDRRHVLKAYGNYEFDFGLTIGISGLFMTGSPLNEQRTATNLPGRPVFLVPRGSAGRLPNLYDISVRLAYKHEKLPGRVLLDFFHIASAQQVVIQDQIKFSDAAMNIPNPNYGNAIGYQPPMFVRVGFEVDF